jgi:hypothetical protein
VARLRAAGAIPIGKTNMPEFGSTAFTKNLLFGVTRNPWNTARTPGGSSGGSSAAVAAGMVPFATGELDREAVPQRAPHLPAQHDRRRARSPSETWAAAPNIQSPVREMSRMIPIPRTPASKAAGTAALKRIERHAAHRFMEWHSPDWKFVRAEICVETGNAAEEPGKRRSTRLVRRAVSSSELNHRAARALARAAAAATASSSARPGSGTP